MLKISPITNVNSTINNKRNISFTSGVRTTYGADAIDITPKGAREGSFIADFVVSFKQSPIFNETLFKRQASIEKGLESSENKINAIA